MIEKKIFFILDWDFTYLFKEVANKMLLNKDLNCLVFGKNYYIDMNNGTIKHPFKKIYSIDEFYETNIYKHQEINNVEDKIKKLEDKYGYQTLWKFVWADRNHIKDGYEKNIYQVVTFFEYFEELYKKEQPDIIITNAYASMPHLISYYVAKSLGIEMLSAMPFRIFEKIYWSEDAYQMLYPLEEFNDKDIKVAKNFIINYRKNQQMNRLEKNIIKNRNQVGLNHIKRFCNYFYNYYITKKYQGHTKPNPFKKLYKEELIPRIKQKYYLKIYKWDKFNKEDKYLFFPLHLQPEMTTMTYAHFYMNQYSTIEALSKNVPMNYKIYVKEHPTMIGRNNKDFYDRLKSLPNVFIVHPNTNNYEIIKNAALITTINGTAGLEGLVLGKPVVTFGKCYYNDCPLVTQLGDIPITKWSSYIKDKLENYICIDDILEKFLALYLHHSHDCIVAEPGYSEEVLDKNNIDNIVNSLKWYLSKKYND
ncbi:hypothetical protein ACOTVL_07460 [Aliarcobacter butzleri]